MASCLYQYMLHYALPPLHTHIGPQGIGIRVYPESLHAGMFISNCDYMWWGIHLLTCKVKSQMWRNCASTRTAHIGLPGPLE